MLCKVLLLNVDLAYLSFCKQQMKRDCSQRKNASSSQKRTLLWERLEKIRVEKNRNSREQCVSLVVKMVIDLT